MRFIAVLSLAGAFEAARSNMRDAAQQGVAKAIAYGVLQAAAFLAVALIFWFRTKRVIATERGLELGSGQRLQLIPWQRVLDVRELPGIYGQLPLHPNMFRVDLTGGEAFDFAGVQNSRSIVIDFVKRSEAAPPR